MILKYFIARVQKPRLAGGRFSAPSYGKNDFKKSFDNVTTLVFFQNFPVSLAFNFF